MRTEVELTTDERRAILVDCQELLARSMWLGDEGDAKGYAECYVPAGVFDRAGTVFVGHTAIASYVAARPSTGRVRHISAPVQIEVADFDHASGRLMTVVWSRRDPGEIPVSVIAEIHDQYIRTPAGWRISMRSAVVAF